MFGVPRTAPRPAPWVVGAVVPRARGGPAANSRSTSRSCSSDSSTLAPQFQQSATPSHTRTDISDWQSGQAHSTAPSTSRKGLAALGCAFGVRELAGGFIT
jgi:hypothetical protein